MNNKYQNNIEVWERKLLSRICWDKKTEDGCKKRTNQEIYDVP